MLAVWLTQCLVGFFIALLHGSLNSLVQQSWLSESHAYMW